MECSGLHPWCPSLESLRLQLQGLGCSLCLEQSQHCTQAQTTHRNKICSNLGWFASHPWMNREASGPIRGNGREPGMLALFHNMRLCSCWGNPPGMARAGPKHKGSLCQPALASCAVLLGKVQSCGTETSSSAEKRLQYLSPKQGFS